MSGSYGLIAMIFYIKKSGGVYALQWFQTSSFV